MDRLSQIIKKMNGRKGYIRISELAADFNVTVRTIRNDLSFLEEELSDNDVRIEKDRYLGVRLSKQGLNEDEINRLIRYVHKDKDFFTFAERDNIIIETLLLARKPVTLNDLERLTLSSRTSLQKNMISCEQRFNHWQISIIKKPRTGILLKCTEKSWRNAVLEHILFLLRQMDFQQLYNNLSIGNISKIFSSFNEFTTHFVDNVDVKKVADFIHEYERKNNIVFTDESFVSVFFFICIVLSRNKCDHTMSERNYALSNFFEEDRIDEWIERYIRSINSKLEIDLNRNELEELMVFMLSRKQIGMIEENMGDHLVEDEQFRKRSIEIVSSFISLIDEYLGTSLSNDEKLFDNLLLHIRPTVYRLLFGIKLENPLKDDIQNRFPEVFAACKFASSAIVTQTNSAIDDNEISYLAIHVEAAFEKAKERNISGYYKTLIICPEGVGTSTILYYRLLNNIPNIIIDRVCSISEFNQIDQSDIDLVISTVPIYNDKRFNVIQVNPLLYENDIIKIKQMIQKASLTKNKKVDVIVDDLISIISKHARIDDYEMMQKGIGSYFDELYIGKENKKPPLIQFLGESFVDLHQEAGTWQDAFRMAGRMLLEKGYISEAYIEAAIKAVEMYGPYMFIGDGVALMHAKTEDGAFKTGFAFMTLSKPVVLTYEKTDYDISLIVVLSAIEDMSHHKALGQLIDIVSNGRNSAHLLKLSKKDEFISFLKKNVNGDLDFND